MWSNLLWNSQRQAAEQLHGFRGNANNNIRLTRAHSTLNSYNADRLGRKELARRRLVMFG